MAKIYGGATQLVERARSDHRAAGIHEEEREHAAVSEPVDFDALNKALSEAKASDYAPKPPTVQAAHLASLTIDSVAELGDHTATQIRGVADKLEQKAKEAADQLRQLATEIEEATHNAGAQVTTFCQRTTEMLEGVKALSDKMKG